MKTLRGLAFRLFKSNKFIVFSSIVSIAISTMLVLSMVLFSFNAQDTLKSQLKQTYGEMDLSVGFDMNQGKILTSNLVEEIHQDKMVDKVSKVSIAHLNLNQLHVSIYTVGVENDYLAKSRYHFSKPLNSSSVAMNKSLAQDLNIKIGDKVLIENRTYTLAETVKDLSANGVAPDMLILNQKNVKRYIQAKEKSSAEATYLLIKAHKNESALKLANHIKSYNKDLRIDIAEQDVGVQNNLQSLHTFIIVLSALVLIITSLILISNFELLLYKMRNQFAIMRSLGASTKQISKIIMIQSTVINITGISLGFILNFLSQRTLYSWVEKLFNIPTTPSEFNVGAAISISILAFIVIQLFLFVPAYRSTKVLPLKTMEENEKLNYSYSKVRVTLSKVLVGIAVFLIIGSQVLPTRGTHGPAMLLISVVLVLLAFVLVFPIWLPKILEWFLPYGQRLFGQEFYISVKNLIPQVRKNTAIILMISSLMIIAVFGSVTLRTIQISQLEQLKKDFATPILIETRIDNSKINSMEFTKTVEELSGVKSVSNFSTLGLAELQTEGKKVDMNYAVVDLKRLQAQGLMAHLNSKTPSNGLILSERFAQQSHLKVGQTVPVGEFSNETQIVESKGTFKVIAIEKQLLNNADSYVDWNNQKLLDVIFYTLYVDSKHIKNTANELEGLKSQYPEIKISNYEQSVKEANKMFYQRWGIFILVIATLVASTMVGVFNSLANNIYSKRKEFAVLRAMGVTPKGLRKIILSQVNLYIGIGLIIGIIMGLLTTFILLLVDPGEFVIDYKVIITVSLLMLAGSTLIFWFVGNKILSQELSIELTNDNK
ncbi:ABC transporter permease [Priestia aryabhattai]|uniref:FtsX-like permease family protein n=1 Tax=Priestia aryabhattai TaxID=412384 RepID=UPI00211BDEF1|nr:FtsX-like permease family protein [Priestia aryabhattai]MCQ9284097.1 ABC transporter permease [Priestia aryabhattai]